MEFSKNPSRDNAALLQAIVEGSRGVDAHSLGGSAIKIKSLTIGLLLTGR